MKCVIFDFDLTLFASKDLEQYRLKRQWSIVYEKLKQCDFYPHAIEAIMELRKRSILVAIVTNAPQPYVSRALKYHGVNIDYLIAYHDVRKHKPDPEGIFKIMDKYSLSNCDVVYVGDNDTDYKTASNANISFVGVEWGKFTDDDFPQVNYLNLFDHIFDS